MLGGPRSMMFGARGRIRERRAERARLEAAFEDDCRNLVVSWAQALRGEGLAEFDIDSEHARAEWITVRPVRLEAAEVSINFDYPTFHVTLPAAGRAGAYDATAELFGDYEERLAEIEQRLDSIAAGRLRWRYKPSTGSGCVLIDWLGADGEPFLRTAYSGGQRGDAAAAGQTAPYS